MPRAEGENNTAEHTLQNQCTGKGNLGYVACSNWENKEQLTPRCWLKKSEEGATGASGRSEPWRHMCIHTHIQMFAYIYIHIHILSERQIYREKWSIPEVWVLMYIPPFRLPVGSVQNYIYPGMADNF